MPVNLLDPAADLTAIVGKINEMITFMNFVQVSGTARYMTWMGPDDVVVFRPDFIDPETTAGWISDVIASSNAAASAPPSDATTL